METCKSICQKLNRTKKLDGECMMETPLKRCLTTFDITLLGIGHMVGAGLYVLTGTVAHSIAGPGTVISFFLAGIISLLSALCYAEFGSHVPKAGSAYIYTYVTIGEFWAFVIGWDLMLEHMIGAASVARAWSGYVDSLLGHVISNVSLIYMRMPSTDNVFTSYPDFVAMFVVIIVCIFIAIGVKGSTNFNTIFTIINILVVIGVSVLGFIYADPNLIKFESFLPFGFSGVLAGAAVCFYAYIGFDTIATSGEETKSPSKSIPLATGIAMAIVMLCYISVSLALTWMVPYTDINPNAALADAFSYHGIYWAKYIIAVGSLTGMITSLNGSLFSLPRCVYAMASDGLIFQFFARVNPKTNVPVIAIIFFGFLTSIIALLFEMQVLVEFFSIGTLMAYTIVCSSIIILRYRPSHRNVLTPVVDDTDDENQELKDTTGQLKQNFKTMQPYLNFEPGCVVSVAVFVMVIFMFALLLLIKHGFDYLKAGAWWAIMLTIYFAIVIIMAFVTITLHQQTQLIKGFKVPFVPLVPVISIFCNIGLMVHLNYLTWIRFFFWMATGLLVYFLYGIHHSYESRKDAAYSAVIKIASREGEGLNLLDESIHRPQPKDTKPKE